MATYPSPTLENVTVQGVADLAAFSSANATITGGSVDNAAIGNTTRSSVKATTIDTTGAATLASVNSAAATLTGGTMDGVTIGGSTPASVNATDLVASGPVSGAGFTNLLSPYPTNATLAASTGAELIGYAQQGTGAVTSDINALILKFIFTPQMFGAVGDDVNDDTTAIQNWLNAVIAYGFKAYCPAPSVAYKLTAPITITSGVSIFGDGVEPIVGNFGTGINTRGRGSWFHISHTGIGFSLSGTANGPAVHFEGIGTYRDQVDPTGLSPGAWTPTVNGADFSMVSTDCEIINSTLLNPTAGITFTSGGRLLLSNVKSQPISYFIDVVQATDTVRFNDVHLWPFWSNESAVRDYQKKNATGFRMGRADNPVGNGLFSIGMYKGMEFYQAAAGITAKGRYTNCDFDSGQYAVLVSGNSVSVQFSNLSAQGDVSDTSLVYSNFQVNGSGCNVQLDNVDFRYATAACVRNQGSGSIINIGNINIAAWNYNNSGHVGIETGATDAEVYVSKKPNILAAGIGSTNFIGGNGVMLCPLTTGGASYTTDASGFITVTHGAGITPRRAFAQLATSNAYLIARTGLSSTSISFQVRNTTTGSAVASTSITMDWQCSY